MGYVVGTMTAKNKERQKQTHMKQVPELLDQEARRVLSSVFRASDSKRSGVDVATYRVKHKKQWDMLEALERDGYLRKNSDSNKYFVSLIGLAQLGAKRAKWLLANSEKLFAELRKHYTVDPHAKVFLTELSAHTGLAVGDAKESLEYMVEVYIVSGHNLSGDKVSVGDMYVLPHENVVSPKYRRFRDLIVERLRWNEDRKAHPQHETPGGFFGGLATKDGPRKKSSFEMRSRQKPSWYRDLKLGIKSLMDEVALAIEADARTLAAMGLRTVIDMACNDVVTDVGNFHDKLAALHEKQFITERQRMTLRNALELGHAAAHRGHVPSRKEIAVLQDIVESLLKQLYVHEPASEKLKKSVPSRKTLQKSL